MDAVQRDERGHCKFVDWVKGGQEGSLRSVTCDGDTGVDKDTQVIGPGGEPVTIPPKIQCGMGSILVMVENWAWGERDLGLEADGGSDSGVKGSFTPVSERELTGKVEDLAGARAQGQDWWAGWTGLAASRRRRVLRLGRAVDEQPVGHHGFAREPVLRAGSQVGRWRCGWRVSELQDTIYKVHSYNLELYDLTQNNPTGDDEGPKEGYTANVEDILKIGQACYEAGDLYDDLLPALSRTFDADKHLADKDGQAISGDTLLVEARDMLEGFLKTACGRYVLAGDQVKASAEAYAKTDSTQNAVFDRVMADWKEAGVGYDGDVNAKDEAGSTDRTGYKPGGGHPTTGGGSHPGAGDGEDYETN